MGQDAMTKDEAPVASPFMRQVRQAGLCLVGAGFMAASVAVSRRSAIRLRAATYPPFYISNGSPATKLDSSDRGLLAVRALGLATLNVMSFGVMLVGGISWAFDLSSIAELRQRTQAHLQKPTNLGSEDEQKMEQELEKLLGTVYSKLGIKMPEVDLKNKEESPAKEDGNRNRNRSVEDQ